MIRSLPRLAAIMLAAAGPAACNDPGGPAPAPVAVLPVAQDRLAAAAGRAAAAAAALAAIAAHRHPAAVPLEPPADIPAELAIPLHLAWTGPISGIARYLAGRAGWRFTTLGLPPVRPVIVSIDSDGQRLADLLWHIGHQAGSRALIEADAGARRIALIYPGADE